MDAGNILKYDINYLENIIINNYLYSPVSSGNINKWTHQTTIEHLNPVNLYEENKEGYLQKSKDGAFTRRQDVPPVYEYNGAIYIFKTKSIVESEMKDFEKIIFMQK